MEPRWSMLDRMNLDLRNIGPSERPEVVLERFDALDPEEPLTVLSDGPEQETRERLQRERTGAFDWHALEEGPDTWLILVLHRSQQAEPRRSVLAFMDRDHRRIEALVADLMSQVSEGEHHAAFGTLHHLRTGLAQHIRIEDKIILPLIATRLHSPRGPAAVLRDQHRDIERRLADLADALAGNPSESRLHLSGRLAELRTLLQNHEALEVRVMYTVADHLLTPDERDELVRHCQAGVKRDFRWQ